MKVGKNWNAFPPGIVVQKIPRQASWRRAHNNSTIAWELVRLAKKQTDTFGHSVQLEEAASTGLHEGTKGLESHANPVSRKGWLIVSDAGGG